MTLSEAETQLKFCTNRLAEAASAATTARRLECDAINAINDAQKTFDKIVTDMRKAAPQSTDWAAALRTRQPVG